MAAVYDHWRSYHQRSADRLDPGSAEYKRIRAALKTGRTVDDCCEAIDGYHRSPFHTGVNDKGQKYLGLGLIFRDSDHITKGIEMAGDPTLGSGLTEKNRRGLHALAGWAAKGGTP